MKTAALKTASLVLVLLVTVLAHAQLRMLLDQGRPQLIGVPPNPATPVYPSYLGDEAYFYGDSVTVGYDPFTPGTPLTNRFSVILCTNLQMIENNFGVGGSQIADSQSDEIVLNNSISNSTVSVWLTGYNDAFWFGLDTNALADNLLTVESMAAWLAIPTATRVPSSNSTLFGGTYGVSNSVIYFPPSWGYNGSTLGGFEYSQDNNFASFYFSGSTLLIGTSLVQSGGGSATVVVGDLTGPPYTGASSLIPVATNVISFVRNSANTGPGNINMGNRNYSAGLTAFTNLSVARHYCIYTPQSSAFTFFNWYASYSTNQLPEVLLAGSLHVPGDDYADFYPAGYTNGSVAAANAYSLMLSNAAATLSGLGLNVHWVPAPTLVSNADYFLDAGASDYIHPDVSGHLKIAGALQNGLGVPVGSIVPDLAPVTVTASESGLGVVPVTCVITNQGNAVAVGNWYDGIWVSTNAVLNTNNATQLGTVFLSHSVPPKGSYSWSTTLTITNPFVPQYLFVVVDDPADGDVISESTKGNNISAPVYLSTSVPPLSITWTNPAAITYGTALSGIQLNASANVSGTFACVPPAGTVLNAGTTNLTAIFTPADTADYAITTNTVTQLVQPAPLTVAANNASRAYGVTNPPLTGTITGIQNGDNITAIFTATATLSSPAGTYPIVATLADPNGRLANYVVTTNNGVLTVNFNGTPAFFFGDSVAIGFNPTPPQPQPNLTNRYSSILCTNLSMVEYNYAVGGSEIADAQADMITTNNYSISNSTLSIWLAGYNDVFWFGTNAAALADNQEAVNSLAAWLAIPTSLRVPIGQSTLNGYPYNQTTNTIYFSTGWLTNTLYGGLAYNPNPGNIFASFYFSGSTLLIGTARLYSTSGSLVVTVGDVVGGNLLPVYVTNNYSCIRTSANTGPGPAGAPWGNRSASPGLVIITNLTANQHYAIVTPQAADAFFGWYASFTNNLSPKVLLTGSLKIAGSNYVNANLPVSYRQGSDQAANQYSLMLSNSAAILSGLGLNVSWIPVPVLNSNTDYFSDGINPNPSGHLKIETALQLALAGTSGQTTSLALTSSMNPSTFNNLVTFTANLPLGATSNVVFRVDGTPVATNALSNGQAAYSTAALAVGQHTVAANYTGDGYYGPSQNSLVQTVNIGGTSVSWNPPSAITYGTGLSALQLNATSSVAGNYTYTPPAGTVLNAGTNTLKVVFVPMDQVDYTNSTNTVSLTVQPAALTVTANSFSRLINVANPVFTGSVVGIQNSDNITATYSTTATISSPAGTYPIVPALADPGSRLVNYMVTTNNGTLTVTNLVPVFLPVCNFFGDSVTIGFNPTKPQPQPNLTNRFSTLLCANLAMIESNNGVGGSEIADAEADAITTNTYAISNTNASVWLAGYNDVLWFGTNQAALADNYQAVESLAAWMAIPTSLRVPIGHSNLNGYPYNQSTNTIYFSAGWNTNTLYGGLAFNPSPGSIYASFYFSGSTLLIGTARLSGTFGSLVVTVGDVIGANLVPVATNNYSCVRTSANTGPGPTGVTWGNRSSSPGLIIFTNLTANRHYAIVAPAGADAFFGWYASYSNNLSPKVVLAGSLKIAGSNYNYLINTNIPAGYTNGSDIAANEYSQMLSNSAVTLSGAGLNVKWVPVPVLDSNLDYFFDGIHPNASGHAKLETAIQAGF